MTNARSPERKAATKSLREQAVDRSGSRCRAIGVDRCQVARLPRKLATASPSGGKPGYYGQPVVKPPVWTWEIPVYFFVGGLAGMSAVIAFGRGDFSSCRSCPRRDVVGRNRRGALANSADPGSRPSTSLHQHAARF